MTQFESGTAGPEAQAIDLTGALVAHYHGRLTELRSDDDALENVAQNIALTEPVQSVLGEGRVVGNGVIEIEPAEPSVCEMEPHLLA